MDIISCKDAKAQGLKHYFTGKPCKYGHIDIRYVTGGCATCQREHTQKSYAKYSKKKNQEALEWKRNNRDKARQLQRDYYARNANKVRAGQSYARAKRMLRIPIWSELDGIAVFYANCPEGLQVDHIIPLQGELVSGLHVLNNLQYLTESDNKAKRNRIDLEDLNK